MGHAGLRTRPRRAAARRRLSRPVRRCRRDEPRAQAAVVLGDVASREAPPGGPAFRSARRALPRHARRSRCRFSASYPACGPARSAPRPREDETGGPRRPAPDLARPPHEASGVVPAVGVVGVACSDRRTSAPGPAARSATRLLPGARGSGSKGGDELQGCKFVSAGRRANRGWRRAGGDGGWRAHNPEAAGSNPALATTKQQFKATKALPSGRAVVLFGHRMVMGDRCPPARGPHAAHLPGRSAQREGWRPPRPAG